MAANGVTLKPRTIKLTIPQPNHIAPIIISPNILFLKNKANKKVKKIMETL